MTVVRVLPSDIARFRKTWPCSGLPHFVSLTVTFAPNGDMTDYAWSDGSDHWDAETSGALSALIAEAGMGTIGQKVA